MAKPLLSVSAVATVGADGIATIRLAPTGEDWEVSRLNVKASTHVLEAVASYYLTNIGDEYLQEASFSGSSGDTTDVTMYLTDGTPLYVQWVGADVGAIATVTIRGWRSDPAGGFRTRQNTGI